MAAIGLVEVALIAVAIALSSSAAGGAVLAVWAAGSVAGGLWFGSRSWRMPAWRQVRLLLLGSAAGFALLLAARSELALYPLAFAAGVFVSPVAAALMADLSANITGRDRLAAFAWLAAANGLAGSLAYAAAGVLVSEAGMWVTITVAAGLPALAAVLFRTGRLSTPSRHQPTTPVLPRAVTHAVPPNPQETSGRLRSAFPIGRCRCRWRALPKDGDDSAVTSEGLAPLLESTLHSLTSEGVAIGAAVDKVTELVCRGSLDHEPVYGQTVFYGASVAKQIVGIAAARAITTGAVDPDDRVVHWIPELPRSMGAVRLRHLIHHTSSLPDVADPALGVPGSNAEIIERFQQTKSLNLKPGVRYAYNNAGYVLVAEAIARALNQPIGEIAAELFTSLGLANTRMGGPAVRLQGRPDPPGTIGDGGLWTSASDLTRWLQACNASAFGGEVQRLAEGPTRLTDGSRLDYAFGVRITTTPTGQMITHGGSWDGWLAKTVRIPDQRIAVAVLSLGATEIEISRAATGLAASIVAQHTIT